MAQEVDPLMPGLITLYEPHEAILDIIFVHGIKVRSVKSWTHKNGVCWPEDLLPNDIPQCRIIVWSYNSILFGTSQPRSSSTIQDHALGLRADVLRYRRNGGTQERPVIFVAHNIGGVVVQAALSESRIEGDGLCSNTAGIIFLGTPHRGLDSLQELYRVARIMSFFGMESRPTMLLKQIKDKETFQSLCADFRDVLQAWPQIRICSCFETQETKFFGTLVKRPLATFGVAKEELLPLEADHVRLSKFFGADDINYVRLLGVLERWTSDIMKERTTNQDEETHYFLNTENSESQQQLPVPSSTFWSSSIEIIVGTERRSADAVVDMEATENILSYESAMAYEQQIHTFENQEAGESLGYADVLFCFRNGVTIQQRRFMVKVSSLHPVILAGSAVNGTAPIEIDSTEIGLSSPLLTPFVSNPTQTLQISRKGVVSAGLMNQREDSFTALDQIEANEQTLLRGTNSPSLASSLPLHPFQENAKQTATILLSSSSLNDKATTPVTTVAQTALNSSLTAVPAAVSDAAGWTSTQTIAATAVGVAGGALVGQVVSTFTTRQSLAVSRQALDISRQSAAASGRSATAAENTLELNRQVFNLKGSAGPPSGTNPTDDDEPPPFGGSHQGIMNNSTTISLGGYRAGPSYEAPATTTRQQYEWGVDDTTFHLQTRSPVPHNIKQSLKGKEVNKLNDSNWQYKELPASAEHRIDEPQEVPSILFSGSRPASSNFGGEDQNVCVDTTLQKPRFQGFAHRPWNKKTLFDYGFKRTTSSQVTVGEAGSSQGLTRLSQLNDNLVERKDLSGTLIANNLASPQTSISMEECSDSPDSNTRNENEEYEPTDEQLVEVESWIESTSGRTQFSDSTAKPEDTLPISDMEGEISSLRLMESPDAVGLQILSSSSKPNERNCHQQDTLTRGFGIPADPPNSVDFVLQKIQTVTMGESSVNDGEPANSDLDLRQVDNADFLVEAFQRSSGTWGNERDVAVSNHDESEA